MLLAYSLIGSREGPTTGRGPLDGWPASAWRPGQAGAVWESGQQGAPVVRCFRRPARGRQQRHSAKPCAGLFSVTTAVFDHWRKRRQNQKSTCGKWLCCPWTMQHLVNCEVAIAPFNFWNGEVTIWINLFLFCYVFHFNLLLCRYLVWETWRSRSTCPDTWLRLHDPHPFTTTPGTIWCCCAAIEIQFDTTSLCLWFGMQGNLSHSCWRIYTVHSDNSCLGNSQLYELSHFVLEVAVRHLCASGPLITDA